MYHIYRFDSKSVVPLEITKNEKDKHIDLLYYKNHFCWIQSLEKLVQSQISNNHKKLLPCRMCLNSFTSEGKLIDHKTYCCEHKCAKILKPELDINVLKFKYFNQSLKIPFVIYADFEIMLEKIHTCAHPDEESYTNAYQKHTPMHFAYYIKYSNGDFNHQSIILEQILLKYFKKNKRRCIKLREKIL